MAEIKNRARGRVRKPQTDVLLSQSFAQLPSRGERQQKMAMVVLVLLTILAFIKICRRTPDILAHIITRP